MRSTHIRRLDLNLLATLQALVEERSISRAAERMFLSQPAMSRSLDRLQQLFGDELLVRSGRRYEPTHRALKLYAELQGLLPRLENLVGGEKFDPATATDTFRVAATDYATAVLFPPLMARIAKLAPNISFDIASWDETVPHRLETNALDLALWMNVTPPGFQSEVLFNDRFMCLVRNGHPVGRAPVTLERYLSYPHAVITLADQRQGAVDRALEEVGRQRRVQLRIPYFSSAAWVIEHSDMVLTVPRLLARRLAKISNTHMVTPPMELAAFRYIQVWHPRLDSDPAQQWLRRLFKLVSPSS